MVDIKTSYLYISFKMLLIMTSLSYPLHIKEFCLNSSHSVLTFVLISIVYEFIVNAFFFLTLPMTAFKIHVLITVMVLGMITIFMYRFYEISQ